MKVYKFQTEQEIAIPIEKAWELTDIVHYAIPLGILGRMANSLMVKKKLKEIFDYRYQKINTLFN